MIIHSFERFGEIRQFDPVTGALTPVSRLAGSPVPTYGHYGLLGEKSVVFYRSGASLLLRIEGSTTPLDDTHRVSFQQNGDRRLLRVTDRSTGSIVASLEYTLPDPVVAPEDDPTPFAEAEDFDFGLFVANVANDRGRRDRIYRDLDQASGAAD
jgi:hypothetical protein